MSTGSLSCVLATLACIGALIPFGPFPSPALDATTFEEVDADNDLLPDDVERVLMTNPSEFDSDGDGTDDFLAAVMREYANPFTDGEPIDPTDEGAPTAPSTGIDHEARVVLSSREDQDGQEAVWMHILFRFAGGTFPQMPVLQPWMSYAGATVPMDGIFGTSGFTFGMRQAGAEGLFLRVSGRLGRASDLMLLAPVTLGVTVVMDARVVSTASILFNASGKAATFAPLSEVSGVVLTLTDDDDPFWTDARVCQLRLSVTASTGTGHICNIDSARCRSAGQLRCPPDCLTSQGLSLFIPDGLATVTGG